MDQTITLILVAMVVILAGYGLYLTSENLSLTQALIVLVYFALPEN